MCRGRGRGDHVHGSQSDVNVIRFTIINILVNILSINLHCILFE